LTLSLSSASNREKRDSNKQHSIRKKKKTQSKQIKTKEINYPLFFLHFLFTIKFRKQIINKKKKGSGRNLTVETALISELGLEVEDETG
jgi:hypothetical protein